MLDYVELLVYMKFQKIRKELDAEIWTKNQICPQIGIFSPFANPKDFFSMSGSVTFVSLWCHNFMQKLEKSNRRSLRYLKTTHGRTHGPTDRGDYIGPLQIKWGLKYKLICKLICKVCFAILAQVLFVKLSFSFMFIDL